MTQLNTIGAQVHVPRRAYFWLTLIIMLAALLRLPALATAPMGGHGDVSWVGLNALDWTDRGVWPFYIREMYSPEFPVVLLNGVLIPFTGISFLSPRLITAGTGLLFVAFLFPATWWLLAYSRKSALFRERAALLASLAGAVSLQAMYLSRLGMESPPFLAVLTLLVWLTAWAWFCGGWWRWVLAGATAGFAQYIYLPARLLPILLAVWIAYLWLAHRRALIAAWRGWLVMASTAFVVALPAIILFATVPGSFSGRADTGTAATGGWIWAYDTSLDGGPLLLMAKKAVLIFSAIGIKYTGPYNLYGAPILGPLAFAGFLLALVTIIRRPRDIAYAWPILAIPVMMITDLISGAILEIHALHHMGILPFVMILAGLGLAHVWEFAERQPWFQRSAVRAVALLLALIVAIGPGIYGTVIYLTQTMPGEYADPTAGVRTEQIDVDVVNAINANPDRAYLLSYSEYDRSNFAWLLADKFRNRRSAIDTAGLLQIPDAPAELTIVTTAKPDRIRHDGRVSYHDQRLNVLLYHNTVYLLPPFTVQQENTLSDALNAIPAAPIVDRSNSVIGAMQRIATPAGLFAPRSVIDYPLNATFNHEVVLKGYSLGLPDQDLAPGKLIYVTLYWQAITQPSEDYLQAVQIWNDKKQSLLGSTDFPYGGAYRVRIWRQDEIVATQHWLQLPADIPVGRYTLAVALIHLIGPNRLPAEGPNADTTLNVALSPDLRVARPVPAAPGTPPPQVVQFGKELAVAGLDVKANGQAVQIGQNWQAKPGQSLNLDITWKALSRPTHDYSVFVHITPDASSAPLAQVDVTMGGDYPTGAWRANELVQDHITITLPAELPPGTYKVLMGVYYWQTEERLPLMLNQVPHPNSPWQIGTVTIP